MYLGPTPFTTSPQLASELYMRTRFVHTEWEGENKRVEPKVEGASQRDWWGRAVLPSLLGGCVLTGAERKAPDELARELREAVKPKLYAYDRYADAYLRAPA
ncbi:MAG: hypothetical protein RXR41_01565 [Candidatus Marsarchaeota archaeon]